MTKKVLCILTCAIAAFVSNSNAQELTVPANLQAAVFKKILLFVKTVQDKGKIEVAILSKDDSGDEFADAFNNAGMSARTVTGGQIPASATVVYLMPGVASPKQVCADRGILSITGTGSYVEDGEAAIGLVIEEGKAKVIVNLKELKAEKQQVASQVLNTARIIP